MKWFEMDLNGFEFSCENLKMFCFFFEKFVRWGVIFFKFFVSFCEFFDFFWRLRMFFFKLVENFSGWKFVWFKNVSEISGWKRFWNFWLKMFLVEKRSWKFLYHIWFFLSFSKFIHNFCDIKSNESFDLKSSLQCCWIIFASSTIDVFTNIQCASVYVNTLVTKSSCFGFNFNAKFAVNWAQNHQKKNIKETNVLIIVKHE